MPEAGEIEEHRAFKFRLEIYGATQGYFMECSGLALRVRDLRYREGGSSQFVRRLPGQAEYSDLTLKYGFAKSPELWSWFMKSAGGEPERIDASIVVLQSDGITESLRWNLSGAWPSEFDGSPPNALTDELAIESLTLVFESLECL